MGTEVSRQEGSEKCTRGQFGIIKIQQELGIRKHNLEKQKG